SFQRRPRSLLSDDGRVFLNLWFIPHPSEVLFIFKTLPEKAAVRALKLTLQLVAPLHDIVAYLLSFAKLGNCSACFEAPLRPHPVRSDWGGAEGLGSELQELQKMIDSLQSPQDPSQVAQALLLRREVMWLQFDAAMRRLLGTVSCTVSLKTVLSFESAFTMFPWRAFLEDGGPFPAMSLIPHTFEYEMQMCLCGLSDPDLEVAHGELVGVQVLMEDVLLSNYQVTMEGSPEWLGTRDNAQPDWSKPSRLCPSQLESHPKVSALLECPCDAVTSLARMKSFLLLWKQLEVLKECWGQLKLQGQEINSAPLYRQFSELYEADIFYPSMNALARQMGKKDEFEGLMITSQSILPPKGASEIEIKTQQLQKLLESLEIHMIQEVLRKVNREITLVLSEKSKKESTLPTDLWKHQVMKENFSVVRPQIVEQFVQRLMKRSQDNGPEEVDSRSQVPPEDCASQESIHSRRECVKTKLMAEQEVSLLRQQLLAVRQALADAQAANRKLCREQGIQAQLLRELEHRVTRDTVTRQQLEIIKTSGMEKLLEDVEQKDQELQLLKEEAERASKLGQLQWRKMDRDLQQVRPAERSPRGPWSPGLSNKVCSPGLSGYLHSGLSCPVNSKHTRK
ncbi:hypothetical protein STEG23_032306, partial [Scotinomys teguina]